MPTKIVTVEIDPISADVTSAGHNITIHCMSIHPEINNAFIDELTTALRQRYSIAPHKPVPGLPREPGPAYRDLAEEAKSVFDKPDWAT